jgi:hypothetical protein
MDLRHMASNERSGRDTYRLMITRRRGTELLLAANDSIGSLPRVEVPTGRRLAEQLTEAARKEFRLEVCCLFAPELVTVPGIVLGAKYSLLESIKQNDPAPPGAYWVPCTTALGKGALPDGDRAAVKNSLQEMQRYVAKPHTGPFARPGWIRELFDWVQHHLDPLGLRVTGRFQQLNASPTFSLIRMETSGPAVWFKATGEPNARELPVTVSLARLFPSYVPGILGVHSTWNGWLSREVPGSTLDDFVDVSAWTRAAKTLAELQIASIGKSSELVESGCKDLRPSSLIEQVDPFLYHMRALMAKQEKQQPAILTDSQLHILSDQLKDACSALQDLGLPHTLGHVDFNPGNILVSSETCIFLDWAEGCVTTPLITFEYLREHYRRTHLEDSDATEGIAFAYLHPWQTFFSPNDLACGMALAPLLAVFAYAVGSSIWRSSETLGNPALAGCLRSLTRRMYREAIRIRERSELCLR